MSSPQTEHIKQRIDLVELVQSYVKLEKSGINFRGRCPFHQERTPSFFVSPTRQTWRCFGCNKGGDHFTFIQEIENVEFPDALKTLADRAGIKLVYEDPKHISERARLHDICEETAQFFEKNLWGENEHRATPVLQYLLGRGLNAETIKNFRIGYAPDSWDTLFSHLIHKDFKADEIEKAGLIIKKEPTANTSQQTRGHYDRYRNRIVFPITDTSGKIIGFGGRIFPGPNVKENEAKYINSPETTLYSKSHVLYAFDKAKQAIREQNQCIVVEGYMDAVMAHQAGAVNTVAVSGTALTPDQLKMIARLSSVIIFAFDMDSAGQNATQRSLALAADFNFERKVLLLPSGKDPADAVRDNVEIFLTAIKNARPLMEYYFEEAGKRYNVNDPQGKKNAGSFFLPHIRMLANEIERAHWIQKFSELISIPETSIRKELAKVSYPDMMRMEKDAAHAFTASAVKKSRRALLEDQLLALYLESPDAFAAAKKDFEEPIPFSALAHERLFEELKKHSKVVSAELLPLYDSLQFQRELLQFSTLKLHEEIRACMRGILTEHYKERRAIVESQIRHLEKTEQKDAMRELLTEFRALSAKVLRYSA